MRIFLIEDVDEFGKVGAETSYLQSQMHSDYESAESIADSNLEDGESREDCESPRKTGKSNQEFSFQER